jgi:hypothetical protein
MGEASGRMSCKECKNTIIRSLAVQALSSCCTMVELMNQEKAAAANGADVVQSTEIPISNDDHVRAVYANTVGASATLTDFRLFFTEVASMPDAKGGSQVVQELRAIVTLPLAVVPALVGVLQQLRARSEDFAKASPASVNKVERE